MTIIFRCPLVLAACLMASPALAQGQRSLLGEMVREGQTVEVIDDQGRESTGKVGVVSSATVRLVRDGKTTEIPFDRIMQIARPADTLANGAWIGFGVGAAFGVLASTAGTTDCDEYPGSCFDGPRFVIGSSLVFGGIGAGIGVGVDALVRHHRIIYRRDEGPQTRVSPLIGRGVKGAMMAVSW